jgi:sec-independent protein translocase protein TatA
MSIGVWQVILILLIVLILFGAGKLPRVMGDLASGIKNFKKGMKEDDELVADGSKAGEAKASEKVAAPTLDATAEPVREKDEVARG